MTGSRAETYYTRSVAAKRQWEICLYNLKRSFMQVEAAYKRANHSCQA